jgi:hypothetical protein
MSKLKATFYVALGIIVVLSMSAICFVALEQWLRFGNHNRLVPIAIGWFLCLAILGLSTFAWLRRVHKIRNVEAWRWEIVREAFMDEMEFLAKVAEARKKQK